MNFMNVDYSTKIPNNVNLSEDRQVLKALEGWHPGYMDWWGDMGPEGFQQSLVYLRTAYSVDPRGWAKFDYVKMPEYRWGILLAPQEEMLHAVVLKLAAAAEHLQQAALAAVPVPDPAEQKRRREARKAEAARGAGRSRPRSVLYVGSLALVVGLVLLVKTAVGH